MQNELLDLAQSEKIIIEFYDFPPPIKGLYWAESGIQPIIGLDKSLLNNTPLLHCVLAEELGHHFTTVGECIPKTYFNMQDRLTVSKAEYKALKWAALYLIPLDNLIFAIGQGCREIWDLAEFFTVTEAMVRFRLSLNDLTDIQLQFDAALIR